MTHSRRTLLKAASALAGGAAFAGLASAAQESVSTRAASGELFNGRGLWTWIPRKIAENQTEQDRFFEKAATHGIGTLFAHYDAVGELEEPLAAAPDADIAAFVRRAHENDIEIHPMIGGGIAGWSAPKVYPHAEQAVTWNENHPPEESFDGIHVDVENGTWQQIRDDLLDEFDGYPDSLTISMAQHPAWVRHNSTEDLRTLMDHRNLDFYCTMVYDRNWATFWPNFGRSIQPWNTPYVLGQGGNEHGHPNRNWSDADAMYAWVEENFVAGEPPTKYQYITGETNDDYLGFSLHSYWALIPAPQGGTIGAPSGNYDTDPSGDGGGGGGGGGGGDGGDGGGGGGNNTAPTASFSASSTTVTTGESVSFDASGSSDSDGSIDSYSWDFTSDGTADASGQTASTTYASAGEYTVTLTVTDDAGATASATTTVTVESGSGGGGTDCSGVPAWDASAIYTGGDQVVHDGSLWTAEWWTRSEPAESASAWTLEGSCGGGGGGGDGGDGGDGGGGDNTAPTASFTTSSSSVPTGDSVTFDASGSSDPDGSIASYAWAFGDGSSATGESASHAYGSTGEYTVTLTVTDDAGATASTTATITVESGGGGGGGGIDCGQYAQWDSGTAYTGGTRVVHDGTVWKAEWWTRSEPDAGRSVWTRVGDC